MPTTYKPRAGLDLMTGAELFNTKIKIYPDGKRNIIYANRQIFHPEVDKDEREREETVLGFDTDTESDHDESGDDPHETGQNAGVFRDDVLKRNRERVFDIVYCNHWDWFLTITFDPKRVDSSNVSLVMSKLDSWLRNRVQRSGLRYILVPEKFKHSDGIHCHALVNDTIETAYSGRVRFGKKSYTEESARRFGFEFSDSDKIYNVPEWKYGFSTALPVKDNSGKLSVYLTKYITKGIDRIFGRYYWSSRNLEREPYIEYTNSPYDEIDLPQYNVPGTGTMVKYDQQMEYTIGSSLIEDVFGAGPDASFRSF